MEGVRSFVCERIALHAVDAENADSPLVEVRAESANHALTFLLPFVAHAGGEGEDGRAVVAVNSDAHVPVQTVRVPILMVTMHPADDSGGDSQAQAGCEGAEMIVPVSFFMFPEV